MGEWVGRLIGGAVIGGGIGFVVGMFAFPDAVLSLLVAGVIVGGWFGFLTTPT
jgi:hypothetical protein